MKVKIGPTVGNSVVVLTVTLKKKELLAMEKDLSKVVPTKAVQKHGVSWVLPLWSGLKKELEG